MTVEGPHACSEERELAEQPPWAAQSMDAVSSHEPSFAEGNASEHPPRTPVPRFISHLLLEAEKRARRGSFGSLPKITQLTEREMEFKSVAASPSACLFSTTPSWGLPQFWTFEEENLGKHGICPHWRGRGARFHGKLSNLSSQKWALASGILGRRHELCLDCPVTDLEEVSTETLLI